MPLALLPGTVFEDKSIKDKEKVINNLIQSGAATQKQRDALNERNLIR